jgi:N-acyl amino acid synthase of PEP-CTERM/exosortase system
MGATAHETPPADGAETSEAFALYDRYFTVLRATTPELLDAAYVLRYQVYCVEHQYEDPAKQVNGREVDEYDAHSVHAVLRYNPTGVIGGCVRLILPQADGGLSTLPVRELLSEEGRARLDRSDPARTAEISRYAVAKVFRRRAGDAAYPDMELADLPLNEVRRMMPHLSVGLMRGIASLAAAEGVKTVCAAMAPGLLRLFERLGLEFELLGPPIDYHGVRQACMADCDALLAGMAARHSKYHDVLETTYHPDVKQVA